MMQEVSAVLALALGLPLDGRKLSWHAVFELARRERCAPLAWSRSQSAIRRLAPADVAAAWRAEALSAVGLAEFWELLLHDSTAALQEAGVDVLTLKGLPLACRLYGDAYVRPCSDLDLYVPAGQRAAADDALHELGWTRRRGEPPNEAVYRIERSGRAALLEVHSALLDDELVAHLPFASPSGRNVLVGERVIPSHDDAQLAAFLAAHLAKHSLPPLLWFIDFDTLWTALDEEEKRRARAAAHAARAHRYLEWAIRRGSDIRNAATGDRDALKRLGFGEDTRSERHSALRVAALAGSAGDAARVVRAWLVPGWVRSPRQAGALGAMRISKLLRRGIHLRASAAKGASGIGAEAQPTRRTVTLCPGDLAAILEHLARRDAGFLIRASGRSMNPSIEPGMMVSLVPRGSRPVRIGDVVLARTHENRCVLHRVVAVHADVVETMGDANAIKDPPMPFDSILAFATGIVSEGTLHPIPSSRWIRLFRRARTLVRSARGRPRATTHGEISNRKNERSARVR